MSLRWYLWGTGNVRAPELAMAPHIDPEAWPAWAKRLARRMGSADHLWCVLVEMDEAALLAMTSRDPAVLARGFVAEPTKPKPRR